MKVTGAQLKLWSNVRRTLVAALSIALLATFVVSLPVLISHERRGPIIAAAEVRAAEAGGFEISAPFALSGLPGVVIESGRIKVLPVGGNTATSNAEVEQHISTGTAGIEIDGAMVRIDLSARSGAAAGQGSEPSAGGPSAGLAVAGMASMIGEAVRSLKFGSVRISNTTLTVSSSGSERSEVHIETAEIQRSGEKHHVKGKAQYRGHAVDYIATVHPPEHQDDGTISLPIKAVVSNTIASTSLTGKIVFGDDMKLVSNSIEFRVLDVPAFASWIGMDWPHEKSISTFLAEGELEWSDSSVAFSKSNFMMDGNSASGSLTVGFRKARTFVEGTLAFERLDVSRYLESETKTRPDAGAGVGAEPVKAAAGFLRPLRAVDADLRISAKTFKAGSFAANGLAATIALNDGRLIADVAEIQLSAGSEGVVQLTIDTSREPPESRLFAKLENFDIAVVSRLFFGDSAVVSGPGRVVAKLVGQPDSYQNYLKGMVGRIEVESEAGVTAGIDLAKLVAAAKTAGGAENEGTVVDPDAIKGSTRLDWMLAVLRVGEGRILAENVIASAGNTAIEARGSTNLSDRILTLDMWLGRGEVKTTLASAIAAAGIDSEQPSSHGATRAITDGDWLRIEGDWARPVLRSERIIPGAQAGADGTGALSPTSPRP